PPEVQARFREAMPDPAPEEYHTVSLIDHVGRQLICIPQQKYESIYELKSLKHDFAGIITYRNKLRDVLLEGVDIQWGKKCVGYEESDDGIWALFDDGTREFGTLLIGADGINSSNVAIPKNMAEKLLAFYNNALMQKSVGINGDTFFSAMRLIPIDQSVDDDDPESVMKHTISRIKQLRPPCELTDLMVDIFSLVPTSDPGEKYPFRVYNAPRRRPLRDIDPSSVPPWKNDRVILLGDAAHAMNPILGLARSSKGVQSSRNAALRQKVPIGTF
ncbi:18592_t:CDS:2, partial [Racocetra fulgida]